MNTEENILKGKLIEITNNNYLIKKDYDYFALGLEMMENIGSTDPELRDELIYGILYNWISNSRFTVEQLKDLLSISLSRSQLFYKLGDNDEDAVFKRTFSVLVVALIINEHRKENFLSENVLSEVKEKLIEYMREERDVRGFIEVKGWAHSAAHTADALDELVQCTCINKIDLMDILNSIKTKVCIGYYTYVDEESERMVTVVENSINRNILSKSEIEEWLQGFSIKSSKASYIENFHSKVNKKGFLRSLYFRLLENEDSSFIINEIKKILNNL